MSYDKQFMDMAIELAKECALQDEVPVGCVVVKDGKVVGASGNRKERENNAICHAEILALSEATKAVGNWWLENCDVYVTLEPCVMCAGAMIHSRIRALYFGAYDDKTGACGSKLNLFEPGLFNHLVTMKAVTSKKPVRNSYPIFSNKREKTSEFVKINSLFFQANNLLKRQICLPI